MTHVKNESHEAAINPHRKSTVTDTVETVGLQRQRDSNGRFVSRDATVQNVASGKSTVFKTDTVSELNYDDKGQGFILIKKEEYDNWKCFYRSTINSCFDTIEKQRETISAMVATQSKYSEYYCALSDDLCKMAMSGNNNRQPACPDETDGKDVATAFFEKFSESEYDFESPYDLGRLYETVSARGEILGTLNEYCDRSREWIGDIENIFTSKLEEIKDTTNDIHDTCNLTGELGTLYELTLFLSEMYYFRQAIDDWSSENGNLTRHLKNDVMKKNLN